jgi:hypothetical protein
MSTWINKGVINATKASGDHPLGVTERTFQQVKALKSVVYYYAQNGIRNLHIRFSMLKDNDEANIDIYLGCLAKDPAYASDVDCELQKFTTTKVIAGQQQGVVATDLFADTINSCDVDSCHPGENHIASMQIDLRGSNLVVFQGYERFDSNCRIWLMGSM